MPNSGKVAYNSEQNVKPKSKQRVAEQSSNSPHCIAGKTGKPFERPSSLRAWTVSISRERFRSNKEAVLSQEGNGHSLRHLSVSLGKEKTSTEKSRLLKGNLFLKTPVQRGIKSPHASTAPLVSKDYLPIAIMDRA